jgi:diguanylate cyclase (GGDEF)-like protein
MENIVLVLAFVLCLTSIGQATALFIQHRINPEYCCVVWWLKGSVLQAVGYISLLGINSERLYLVSIIAFPLIVFGQLLYYKGIIVFLNIKGKHIFYILFYIGFLSYYCYYFFVIDCVVRRSVIVAIVIMIILIASAFKLFKNKEKMIKSSARFAGVVYSLHAFFLAFYTVYIVFISNNYAYEVFQISMIRMIAYIVPIITSMLSVFAFIIMVNQGLNSKNLALVEQLKGEKEVAELNAITDSLTGLMNRRFFDKILDSEFKRSKRSNLPLSMIMLDIDYFKNYNDSYGHLEGDRCLSKLGEALRKIVSRTADIVGRYGGEEFYVILPETDANGADTVAKKIKSAIDKLEIPHNSSKTAKIVTISIGVATIYTKDYKKAEDLIELADNAMYKAKEGGRNQIVNYNEIDKG